MPTKPYDFKEFAKLLDQAGITTVEAAELFKTTRPSIYHWRRGNAPTQQVTREYAERLITVITKAISAGDLPLAEGYEKEERMSAFSEVIRKHSGR